MNYCGAKHDSPWSKHGLKLEVCTADQAQLVIVYTLYVVSSAIPDILSTLPDLKYDIIGRGVQYHIKLKSLQR